MSSSLRPADTCGLATPWTVIIRFHDSAEATSYCELASAIHGISCGWVPMTWNDSTKASSATFQLQAISAATWR